MTNRRRNRTLGHPNRDLDIRPIKHRLIQINTKKGIPVQKVVLVNELALEEEVVAPVIPTRAVMVCSSSDFKFDLSANKQAFINEIIEINNTPRKVVDNIGDQVRGLFNTFSRGSSSWRYAVA